MIDNYIMDQSPRITMTLSEILANTPPVQTLAQATDVPGTNLEWMKTAAYPTGAWFGDLGELGTTAFRDGLFTGYLATGARASVNGVQYTYGAAGWGAPPGAWVYVGTNIPLSGSYIGQLIQVDNAAVPGGRSILRWNGTIWAPPAGELIASTPAGLTTAGVTPAVTDLTKIWESPVIPDYMLPIFLEMEISGNMGARNAGGAGVAGCVLGCGIVGSVPTAIIAFSYPLSATVTPPTAFSNGIGSGQSGKRMLIFRGASSFSHQDPNSTVGGVIKDSGSMGNFVSGANRLYAMAKPSSVTDTIRLDGIQVWSKGNL